MCASLAVVWGRMYLTQRSLNGDITRVLGQLTTLAESESAEALADDIDKRKDTYPDLIILLAQRNKVRTLLGKVQFQTRWRAGTLRLVEWPVVPTPGSSANLVGSAQAATSSLAGNAEQVIRSDWITMTAYHRSLVPVRMTARYVYLPEREASGQPGLLVIVGRDKAIGDANITQAAEISLAFVAFALMFVTLSGFLTTKFVVGRLEGISDTATNIIGGDLSRRVPVGPKGDEFDRLSETLNRMLDRIQRLLGGMREVSDNIAHDLRTPLFRLRSRIELAMIDVDTNETPEGAREALEVALKEAEGLLATFNALMSIAQLEAGATVQTTKREDVAAILRDIADLYEPVAEDRGLKLVSEIPQGLHINCHRELIVQALSNLVDNAFKYAPEGTTVTIGARLVQPVHGQGRAVELYVSDQGPGIPREDRERVIKRFVRLERGREVPGSGLGLSLVAAVAQVHEAELKLDDGPGGRGLEVRLVIPSA